MSGKLSIEIDIEIANRIKIVLESQVDEDRKSYEEAKSKFENSKSALNEFILKIKSASQTQVVKLPLINENTPISQESSGVSRGSNELSWVNKFKELLKRKNCGLTVNEAFEHFRRSNPEIGKGMNPVYRKIQATLSGGLKQQVDGRKLNRIKNEKKQFVYGFPEWFEKDGNIKSIYNKNAAS